jgi:hypothetical protein
LAVFHGSSPAGDWAALLERLDRTGAFPRWQGQEAALAAVPCLADLPSHTGRGAERAAADRIMGALVRIAAVDGRDDTDAALVLVHLLRNGIVAMAARLDLGYPTHWTLSLVISELTCRIRSFPWRRRSRAHAANLLLETKRALLAERPVLGPDRRPRVALWDPFYPGWLTFEAAPPARDDWADLLGWADQNNVAVADDMRMLLRLHQLAGYGTNCRHRVAAEFGINERTLRRRRDRTLAALRYAAPRFLEERAA